MSEQGGDRAAGLDLDTDQLDVGPQGPGRGGHPGQEPTTADRDHEHVEVGPVGQHLGRHRPLAGDDGRVVVGRHGQQPLGLTDGLELGPGVGQAGAGLHHPSPQAAGVDHLGERGGGRHDDRGRQTEPGREVGHPLGVVAGGEGDQAPIPIGLGQGPQVVGRPPVLERAGELEVLELDEDLAAAADDVGQGSRQQGRRPDHVVGDPLGRPGDVVGVDGEGHLSSGGR